MLGVVTEALCCKKVANLDETWKLGHECNWPTSENQSFCFRGFSMFLFKHPRFHSAAFLVGASLSETRLLY